MVSLKPQDVMLALKLALHPGKRWPFVDLAREVGLSSSEAYMGVFRLGAAGLLDIKERRPRLGNLIEFLEHGVRYAFISDVGAVTRGLPTAHSASPLADELVGHASDEDGGASQALVWPHPEGTMRGQSFEPLYPSVVDASLRDARLHECLALVDALRIGRARERNLAAKFLKARLRPS
jgi:hypothetical protein